MQDDQARKLPAFEGILSKLSVRMADAGFIGDDLPDVPILRRVGLPVAVANATPDVLSLAHHVTKASGGNGAVREFVEEFRVDGHRVFVLGEGRLINLSAAEGHPAAVMDMSFANQALAAEYLVQHGAGLDVAVHRTPENIDQEIARLKLEAMNVAVDVLTEEQKKYLSSWDLGT